jgi:hypothetical protein
MVPDAEFLGHLGCDCVVYIANGDELGSLGAECCGNMDELGNSTGSNDGEFNGQYITGFLKRTGTFKILLVVEL